MAVGLFERFKAWLAGLFGGGRSLGARGEAAAASMLARKGYRLLGKNLRLSFGEIDLLVEDPDGRTIVLVEVKTRRRGPGAPGASARVAPEASITRRKARTLVRLLDAVTRANGWEGRPKRIDVVAVEAHDEPGGERLTLRHFLSAVGRS